MNHSGSSVLLMGSSVVIILSYVIISMSTVCHACHLPQEVLEKLSVLASYLSMNLEYYHHVNSMQPYVNVY